MLDERFGGTVRQSTTDKVRVIQRQGEARNAADEAQRFPGFWNDGADVGLNAEDNALLARLLETPCQLIATALPGVSGFLAVKIHSGQRGHMPCAANRRVIQSFEKPMTRNAAPCGL